MTHPDILKMERDGYLGNPPKQVGICKCCREPIEEGNTYFDDHEGGLFCCFECVLKSVGITEERFG